jgi:hypothetical protein
MQHWSHVFTLMQLNPQSTAGGLMESLTADKPWPTRFSGVAAPQYQFIANMAKNAWIPGQGEQRLDLWRAALNEAAGLFPGERKLFPSQGLRADSLPWLDWLGVNAPSGWVRPKTYTDPITGQLRSPFLNPGARADRGPTGFLERAFGFGGYQVPNQGAINNPAIDEQTIRAIRARAEAAPPGAAQGRARCLEGRAQGCPA